MKAINQRAEYKTGGLRIGSLWYEDDAYVSALTTLWVEGVSQVEKWFFSRADVEAVREFVKNYGVGNSLHDDGLIQFSCKFSSNIE